jgi:glycosyltransferase involved in cell wall biosynthesis
MKALIVMPARNEAQTIATVIAQLKALVPEADILVVNDASTDETAWVAASAGAKVVTLPIHLGYGGAVQTGFKYAARKGYDAVVLMDADGQHNPACVPDLLKGLQDADVVLGSRFLGDCRYFIPFDRRVGMWLLRKIVRWVTGQSITDPTSGFQALRRQVVELLADDHYPVDFADADILILLHRVGFRIKEIPVVMHQRSHGISKYVPSYLRAAYYAFKMSLSILATLLRAAPKR